MSMTVHDMADDLKKRIPGHPDIGFRRLESPPSLKGQIAALGLGWGASPIFGLSVDEESAYADALERSGQMYDWVVDGIDESALKKILKRGYELREAQKYGKVELAGGKLFIRTSAINFYDLTAILKGAKVAHKGIGLE